METVVGPIFEIAKMIFAPICKYCKYYKGANKYRRILRDKWRDLERRKSDKTLEMRAQLLPGKTPKQEVEGWIQDVEELNDEIEAIEREAGVGKCFSRARIGKLAFEKIQEVEKLHQKGDFPDSLVIDLPPSNGEIMPTPTLIGESTAERVKEEIWACMLDDEVRKIGLYGMGGIGKSTVMEHINNRLVKEKNKFDYVIWVTVSKCLNVIQLQDEIARKLRLNLAEGEDVRERAAKLMEKLKYKNRYVLISSLTLTSLFLFLSGTSHSHLTLAMPLISITLSPQSCHRRTPHLSKLSPIATAFAEALINHL